MICGGVHTANATVYLIGSVLDPTKMATSDPPVDSLTHRSG